MNALVRLTRADFRRLLTRYQAQPATTFTSSGRVPDGVTDYSYTETFRSNGRVVLEIRYRPAEGRAEVWGEAYPPTTLQETVRRGPYHTKGRVTR